MRGVGMKVFHFYFQTGNKNNYLTRIGTCILQAAYRRLINSSSATWRHKFCVLNGILDVTVMHQIYFIRQLSVNHVAGSWLYIHCSPKTWPSFCWHFHQHFSYMGMFEHRFKYRMKYASGKQMKMPQVAWTRFFCLSLCWATFDANRKGVTYAMLLSLAKIMLRFR